jgi:hypothetical protein
MTTSLILACLITAVCIAVPAKGDDAFPPISSEELRSECGDCHLVYQPQMLPERSWRRLMGGLSDHFGEELEIDRATGLDLLAYLTSNAADTSSRKQARKFLRDLSADDVPMRITDTPRWREKHRELPERVWSDERIQFKGQCEVCHTKAERGIYDDDDGVRLPGPNGTWRRWEDD